MLMLMGLASALAWLLTVVVLAFVTLLLICSGPIASFIGYRAIINRLWSDDPENPVLDCTWERLTAARQRRIVTAYFETYGFDLNIGLTIGGLAVTIPGWYLSGYTGQWLNNLLHNLVPSMYL